MTLSEQQTKLVNQWYEERLTAIEETLGLMHAGQVLMKRVMDAEEALTATTIRAEALDATALPTEKKPLYEALDQLHRQRPTRKEVS